MTDLGTPIKCRHCGREDTVRLRKGVSLKTMCCGSCGSVGFVRNTDFDKERKVEPKSEGNK